MSRIYPFTVIVLLLGIWGCAEQRFYEQSYELTNEEWYYEDVKDFTFVVQDTTARYDLMMSINHSTSYEYQNLYLKLTTVYPDRESRTQELSVDFADSQGRWYGDCNSKSCKVAVTLQRNAFFNQTGSHTIKVVQHMRISPIQHVQAVTLSLDKHKRIDH